MIFFRDFVQGIEHSGVLTAAQGFQGFRFVRFFQIPISDGHFLSKVAKNGFSGSNIPAHISGISKNNGTRVVGAIVLYI